MPGLEKGADMQPRGETIASASESEEAAGPASSSGPGTPFAASGRGGRGLGRAASWLALLAAFLLLAAAGLGLRQAPHPDMWRSVGNWDVARWDWWAYPLERNAFKRLVVRGDLAGVHVSADGARIWAVGAGGLILHSPDGGRTWQQQNPRAATPAPTRTAGGFEWLSSAHAALPEPATKGESIRQRPPVEPQPSEKGSNIDVRQAPPPPSPAGAANPPAGAANPPASAASPVRRPPVQAPAPAAPASAPTVVDPLLADLSAVVFVDAERGWAVGHDGALLATVDGGETWLPQPVPTRQDLYAIAATADGRTVLAVGSRGTTLIGSDQGRTWTPGQVVSTPALRAVRFGADGRTAWAVGEAGTAFRSGDGGASWTLLATGVRRNLKALHFARDGLRGVVAGDDGTLLTTADGGTSWRPVETPLKANWRAMAFEAGGMQGVLVGDGGALITADAGETWAPRPVLTREALSGVSVGEGGGSVWTVGSKGTLLQSRSGGPWMAQASGGKALLHDLRFDPTGSDGVAVGGDGAILRSTDGGRTWTPRGSGTDAALTAVARVPQRRLAWAVGERGTVLASTDDGDTWQPQKVDLTDTLTAIDAAADGQRVRIAGLGTSWLTTRDGGRSWQSAPNGTGNAALDMWFAADGQRGYVSDLGRIRRTVDGGQRWESSESFGLIFGSVAASADGTRVWVAGWGGRVLLSTDGGRSWRAQRSGTSALLHDIEFLPDGTRGWAAGTGGTVIASRDGGETWAVQPSGATAALRSVQILADGKRGFISGDAATLLGTVDGGDNWKLLAAYSRNPPPWALLALAFSAGLFAFAITFGRFRAAPADSDSGSASRRHAGALARMLDDQPLTDIEKDRLGHAPAVLALSAFMRNRDTDPKLTIAITAPWGMGKSSMMGMLRNELHKAGFRTAWFNAWHHQQEGRQLSALFNVIRRQAVPSIFRQPFAALRVRARLLWARGWAYRIGVPLLALPLLALLAADVERGRKEGVLSFGDLLHWNFAHHWLKQPRIAVSGYSLAKLSPFAAAASAPPGAAAPRPATDGCVQVPEPARKADAVLRTEVYCYLQRAVVLQADGERTACGLKPEQRLVRDEAARAKHGTCIFESADQLFDIADASIPWRHKATGAEGADRAAGYVLPSERKAIVDAAEVLEPPPLLPTIEHFIPLLALLGLVVTKGLSVYGFQLLSPLRSLLGGAAAKAEGGNEPTGTVERYRTEFCLLTEALDGRLVVFIDDLDRCDKATVNGMLEMTNYLIDHGRVFIVIGAAMEHVKLSIEPKLTMNPEDLAKYQVQYLRKIVHIELPVPAPTGQGFERLLDDGSRTAAGKPSLAQRLNATAAVMARGLRPTLLVLAVLLVAGWAAQLVWRDVSASHELTHVAAVPPGVPASAASAPPVVVSGPLAAPVARAASAASGAVGLDRGGTAASALGPAAFAALAVVLFALWLRGAAGQRLERLKVALGGAVRTRDTPAFIAALRMWEPAVRLTDATPRGLKRFCNRARLFAIHEFGDVGAGDLDEVHVVALTALHHVDPTLLDWVTAALRDGGEAELLKRARDRRNAANASPADVELMRILEQHIGFFQFADLRTAERFHTLLGRISVR